MVEVTSKSLAGLRAIGANSWSQVLGVSEQKALSTMWQGKCGIYSVWNMGIGFWEFVSSIGYMKTVNSKLWTGM